MNLPLRQKENAITLTNIIAQNLLPHRNIKINFCIFTPFFLTQNNGKLDCWKLLRTYAEPFSKKISFDGHLHCCSPTSTSALTSTCKTLTWVYETTGTADLEDLTTFSCLSDVSSYRTFYVLVLHATLEAYDVTSYTCFTHLFIKKTLIYFVHPVVTHQTRYVLRYKSKVKSKNGVISNQFCFARHVAKDGIYTSSSIRRFWGQTFPQL
jgi:hypothetical protein